VTFLTFLLAAVAAGLVPALAQGPAGGQGGGRGAAAAGPPLPDAATLLKVGQPSGPQGDTWESIKLLPDFSSTKWTMPGGGPGGRGGFGNCTLPPGVINNPYTCMNAPWTTEWQKKFDAIKKIAEAGGDVPARPKRCVPSGYSGALAGGGIFEILLTPGQVTITTENGLIRRIYTDGRKHPAPADLDDSFNGHNVGHWENGTLVVDTVGLDPENEITYGIQGGKGMHVVTRTRLVDANTIEHISILVAPEALKEPRITRTTAVRERRWEMHEQLCVENQRDLGPNGEQIFDLTPPPPDKP
jgi:hypothetical protein